MMQLTSVILQRHVSEAFEQPKRYIWWCTQQHPDLPPATQGSRPQHGCHAVFQRARPQLQKRASTPSAFAPGPTKPSPQFLQASDNTAAGFNLLITGVYKLYFAVLAERQLHPPPSGRCAASRSGRPGREMAAAPRGARRAPTSPPGRWMPLLFHRKAGPRPAWPGPCQSSFPSASTCNSLQKRGYIWNYLWLLLRLLTRARGTEPSLRSPGSLAPAADCGEAIANPAGCWGDSQEDLL